MAVDLSGLNPSQRAAVEHYRGAMLVLAGAGSGKTRVVTHRIARLIERGVPQKAILGVTFTNKAAREMRERLVDLIGKPNARGVTLSTFHSLCARILRKDAHRIDVSTTFTILDASDQLAQLARVQKELGLASTEVPERMVLARIGWFKNQGYSPADIPADGDDVHLIARRVYGPYAEHLRQLQAVDFDDLLLHTKRLLEEAPDVRKRYQQRFRFILIDEYQDTNPVQMGLVEQLVNEEQNLCVVGDDDQAIYGFRGSAVENILNFDRQFAPCQVVKLEENYRSTPEILACANAVIAHNQGRKEKQLKATVRPGLRPKLVAVPDGEAEGEHVAVSIKKHLAGGRLPGDIAVLYRANPQSRQIEESLRLHDIPYRVVGGQEFFERKDVKNVVAYLSLMARPDDEIAFRRVVNLPARGMGQKAVDHIVAGAREAGVPILHWARKVTSVKPSQQEVLSRFTGPLLDAAAVVPGMSEEDDPGLVLERAILDAGLRAVIDGERDLVVRERVQSALEETLNAFSSWFDRVMDARSNPDLAESWLVDIHKSPLETFLDRIALDEEERRREQERRKEGDKKPDEGRVTLMSIHASKGLEFPVVYLVGFEEGLLPHRRVIEEDPVAGIEEERRLCYVGITRAREDLTFTWATARRRRRQLVARKRSRFAAELPEAGIEALGEEVDTRSDTELATDFFAGLKKKLGGPAA